MGVSEGPLMHVAETMGHKLQSGLPWGPGREQRRARALHTRAADQPAGSDSHQLTWNLLLPSLGLTFLFCKMGAIVILSSWGCKVKNVNTHKAFRTWHRTNPNKDWLLFILFQDAGWE